ncbi:helix-turn-helix domain-containing protein [Lysinibacillus telephonicus]|uniref:helix-turn-helix domain-containing protein n=1 Tax=Lysinibacillus telephonicus TaxID=1714840 RepID=UPI0037CE0AE7
MIGATIKNLRIAQGLTQIQLCEMLGITQGYLTKIENNLKNPSPELISKIAFHLKTSKLYLFREAGLINETDIPNLLDENVRLREALEHIATHNIFVTPQLEIRAYAQKTLEGN